MTRDDEPLLEMRLRAVRVGVALTFLVAAVLGIYIVAPGHVAANLTLYLVLIGAAVAGGIVVAVLPWRRVLEGRSGSAALYVWSVFDIALISLGVAVTGKADSPLFWLYVLTGLFSAITCYAVGAQVVLFALTTGAFVAVSATGPGQFPVARTFLDFAVLALAMGLAGYLSHEMVAQAESQGRAAAVSRRRAELLGVVAAAARSTNSLDLERVLDTVVDAVSRLGFDACELCLYDDDRQLWTTARSVGITDPRLSRGDIEEGVAGAVWRARRTIVVEDCSSPEYGLPGVQPVGFGAVVASPIWSDGQLRGALIGGRKMPGGTPAYLTECIELLAAQAGSAFDNSQRFAERSRYEAELAYRSSHDALTGLPNRTLFAAVQEEAKAAAGRSGRSAAVLLLDLDRFKGINDTMGHELGDQLLAAVANRLRGMLEPTTMLARNGGDEFAVLVEDMTDETEGLRLAHQLAEALLVPFEVGASEVFTSASIGVAYIHPGSSLMADALREAELAMYRAKERGKGRCEAYHSETDLRTVRRHEMEGELRRALDANELFLVYQPVVNLDSASVIGVEALLRWRHPRLGLVGPADFVALAEDSGLIIPIGRWVLKEACEQVRRWESQGGLALHVAVNLSGRQFRETALVDEVTEVLLSTGLPPARLTLEITETVAMEDLASTVQTVRELARLGVGIALDDFGQGSSSLGALKAFPVDSVKVDKVFVAGMEEDGPDRTIVASVISLARSLGIGVTAEGIERSAQLDALRALGCARGQGYYLSRPLTPDLVPASVDAMASHLGAPARSPAS